MQENLTDHIKYFLLTTAKWSCRWFNKPKFHILIHLPEHIRCFGPAILFATEAFELFNLVIRSKSVHSNRQAPSRDIGRAFAQGNHIWHILSRGFFPASSSPPVCDTTGKQDIVRCSTGPQYLLGQESVFVTYLGLQDSKNMSYGECSIIARTKLFLNQSIECAELHSRIKYLADCVTGQHLNVQGFSQEARFKRYKVFKLPDGEKIRIGQYIIFRHENSPTPFLGIMREIVQEVGSPAELSKSATSILVQIADISCISPTFRIPEVFPAERWAFIWPNVSTLQNFCI